MYLGISFLIYGKKLLVIGKIRKLFESMGRISVYGTNVRLGFFMVMAKKSNRIAIWTKPIKTSIFGLFRFEFKFWKSILFGLVLLKKQLHK